MTDYINANETSKKNLSINYEIRQHRIINENCAVVEVARENGNVIAAGIIGYSRGVRAAERVVAELQEKKRDAQIERDYLIATELKCHPERTPVSVVAELIMLDAWPELPESVAVYADSPEEAVLIGGEYGCGDAHRDLKEFDLAWA